MQILVVIILIYIFGSIFVPIEQIDHMLSFLIKNAISLIIAFYIIGYILQFYPPTTKIKNYQRRSIYIFFYMLLIVLGCIILGFIFFFKNVELTTVGIVLMFTIIDTFILYHIDNSNSLVNKKIPKKNIRANQDERNNMDKRNEGESLFDTLTKLEIEKLERECEEIEKEISGLRYERDNIRTSNNILDEISGSKLSKSKLRYNQRRYDEFTRQIQDKENELSDKRRSIEFKKNILG